MKLRTFILSVALLTGLYGVFRVYDQKMKKVEDSNLTIHVPEGVLEVSAKATEDELKQGVTAKDNDGDFDIKQIKILNISNFDENKHRVVTYIVYNYHDEWVTATREIAYTDYEMPSITLTRPMMSYYIPSDDELKTWVKASSCIDGDITSLVNVNFQWQEGKKALITYSVTDSAGSSHDMTYLYHEMDKMNDYEIELSAYFVPTNVGEPIDPRNYIKGITYNGTDLSYLAHSVDIETDYDPNTPGTYDIYYKLNRNGEFGVTKLIVSVG